MVMSSTLFDLFHGEVIRECFSESSSDSTRKDSPNGIRTLKRLGRDVGSRLVQCRVIEKPGVSFELLSAVRYVCRDIWLFLHKKKIDKLETDNAGTYILHDANYQWVLPLLSNDVEVLKNEWIRKRHLAFSVGFLQGCFETLGWKCEVSVKVEGSLPYCKFHCKFEELEKELEEKRSLMKTPGPKKSSSKLSPSKTEETSVD